MGAHIADPFQQSNRQRSRRKRCKRDAPCHRQVRIAVHGHRQHVSDADRINSVPTETHCHTVHQHTLPSVSSADVCLCAKLMRRDPVSPLPTVTTRRSDSDGVDTRRELGRSTARLQHGRIHSSHLPLHRFACTLSHARTPALLALLGRADARYSVRSHRVERCRSWHLSSTTQWLAGSVLLFVLQR